MKVYFKKITLCGLFIIAAIISYYFIVSSFRLSDKEIELLREQYPIYRSPNTQLFLEQIDKSTLIKMKYSNYDNIIYGEVQGECYIYYKHITTNEISEKKEGNLWRQHFSYNILIIDDVNNEYQRGNQISIDSPSTFRQDLPKLADGMKIVVPIAKENYKENCYGWNYVGFYYVTEGDYVIAAYEEEVFSPQKYTGIKVERLMYFLSDILKNSK